MSKFPENLSHSPSSFELYKSLLTQQRDIEDDFVYTRLKWEAESRKVRNNSSDNNSTGQSSLYDLNLKHAQDTNKRNAKIQALKEKMDTITLIPHEVLGVKPDATGQEIYEAYTQKRNDINEHQNSVLKVRRMINERFRDDQAVSHYFLVEEAKAINEDNYYNDLENKIRAAYQELSVIKPYIPAKEASPQSGNQNMLNFDLIAFHASIIVRVRTYLLEKLGK